MCLQDVLFILFFGTTNFRALEVRLTSFGTQLSMPLETAAAAAVETLKAP